jgi:LysM repeat protein
MRGRRRSPARLIAPVALLLAAAAVLLVVQSTLEANDSDDGGGNSQTEPTSSAPTTEQPAPQRARYTVKLNDTLELIAEKTGVSVERLQELNPELDPQALIVGQKIKLRE